MTTNMDNTVVCVIGLGYVGLPLLEAFSRSFNVIGFDTSLDKINKLSHDNSGSGNSAVESRLTFTTEPEEISKADFIIIYTTVRWPSGYITLTVWP